MCMEDLWSNLPTDLLRIILSCLPLSYHPNFASVCKSWNAVCTHKLYRIKQVDRHPLLVYVKDLKRGIIYYYSPIWNKTFKVKCSFGESKLLIFNSKDGWLVMYKYVIEKEEEVEVLLYNPAINVSYSYPGLKHDHLFSGITFSGCPLRADFVIFGISSREWHDDCVVVTLWKEGGWKIQNEYYDNQSVFVMSTYSSPVVYKDCFYCVSETGKLGVFNPKNESWNILTHPKGFSMPGRKEVYVIGSEDGIKAVVCEYRDPRVFLVFYLNHDKMAWEQKRFLDTQSMFIGPKVSVMINLKKMVYPDKAGKTIPKTNAILKAMRNRVFTARFYGRKEELEAEMKISEGQIFFLASKVCDSSESKDEAVNGGILSCGLQRSKTDHKYRGSSQCLHCVWYKPEILCRPQVQKN